MMGKSLFAALFSAKIQQPAIFFPIFHPRHRLLMDTAASIWHVPVSLEGLNTLNQGTLGAHLGIVFTEVGPDFLRATLPVDHRTMQPYGRLHGGASVALAETLGSVGATLCVDPDQFLCVGLEVNANHVRPVHKGVVTGTARPLHRGTRTQVWEVHLHDEAGELTCISRITLAIIART
jgi:1,4-dihydroxy-2-naphthoyl-CoA hydrolase